MSCTNYITPYSQDFNIEIRTYVFEGHERENTDTYLFINCESLLEIVNPIEWTNEDYSLEMND